ncbi:Plasmodium variant antigen protein Cir/Yir/Bir, putative, partial [Plasmodium chabaudi chabaudi]
MQNHKRMCKLLLEGDSYFNDENVDTEKINKDITIKGYCRNGSCKTNEESISALTSYIFKKFKDSIVIKRKYNHYDECLLMWVSDKLFKVHLKNIGKKDVINYMDGTTLNQAYEKYLEKNKGKLDYWTLFNIIGDLKEANLKYMSEYYKLLNLICKLITDYYNGVQTKQLYKYPSDCSLQYKNLYRNIYECKPYLDLLNKLKGIYDDFSSVIKKTGSNPELATKLKKLTPQNGKELKAVKGFKTYDINNTKCKFPKKKPTTPKASKPNPGPAPTTTIQKGSPGSQGVSNTAVDQLSNQEGTSKSSDSNQHKTTNEIGKQSGGIVHKPEQSPDGQQQNSGSKQGTSSSGSENSDVLENRGKIPSTDEPEKQPLVSETKEPSLPEKSQGTQLQTQSDPAQTEGSNRSDGQGGSKIDLKTSNNSEGNTGGASGDTRSPNSESRGPGGGLNDGTPKRTDHADTSPPGPQASNQAPGSENKENVGGSTQSEQKNGSDPPSPQEPQRETQRETQQSSSTTPPEDPPTKPELPSSSQESQELGKNNQNELPDSGKETGGSKSEIKGPEVEKGKKIGGPKEPGDPSDGKGSQVNGDDRGNSEPGGADTEKSGAESG